MGNITTENAKRKGRVGSLLKEVISSFIRAEIDPEAMVTVMRVEMASDLHLAKVFISVFPEEKEEEVMKLLKKQGRRLKDFIKNKTSLKFLPDIRFEIDRAWKLESKIDELLNKSR